MALKEEVVLKEGNVVKEELAVEMDVLDKEATLSDHDEDYSAELLKVAKLLDLDESAS